MVVVIEVVQRTWIEWGEWWWALFNIIVQTYMKGNVVS